MEEDDDEESKKEVKKEMKKEVKREGKEGSNATDEWVFGHVIVVKLS